MTEAHEGSENPEHVPEPDHEAESPLARPETTSAERPLDAERRERPGFLREFPNDPELQKLVRAFEAGNYGAIRVGAPKLAEKADDPAVRGAARELRRRIDPDPLVKYLLLVAVSLFVFVVWYTYQNHSR